MFLKTAINKYRSAGLLLLFSMVIIVFTLVVTEIVQNATIGIDLFQPTQHAEWKTWTPDPDEVDLFPLGAVLFFALRFLKVVLWALLIIVPLLPAMVSYVQSMRKNDLNQKLQEGEDQQMG